MHSVILASAANGDPGNVKLFLGIGVVFVVICVAIWAVHR
jgi:hypothetical protein